MVSSCCFLSLFSSSIGWHEEPFGGPDESIEAAVQVDEELEVDMTAL